MSSGNPASLTMPSKKRPLSRGAFLVKKMKKLISWNVNGLRAVLGKGFTETVKQLDADIVCLQETKLQAGQCELDLPVYHA